MSTKRRQPVPPPEIAPTARLDRLPIGGFHRKLLAVSGLGWMFGAMGVGIISLVVATLAADRQLTPDQAAWQLTPNQAAWLISVTLLGTLVGAAMAGTLADRFGRKTMFQATLLTFSLAIGLSGLAWSYEALMVGLLLVGFGLGGELPAASTLVSELSPARERGRMLVLLASFWAYGWILAGLIAFFVVPQYGWRAAFFLGALPVLYVFVLRRALPESPRFLLSQGRAVVAEAVIGMAERASGVTPPRGAGHQALLASVRPRGASAPQHFLELWSRPFLRGTAMLWLLWFTVVFSYCGIFIWLPILLAQGGVDLIGSFRYLLIFALAQIPGYFSAAYLVERIGRKWTLAPYLLLAAVGAFFFGNAGGETEILIWGCFISFFLLGAWGVAYSYTQEMYPTRIRGTGAGWAAACGWLGGVLAPVAVAQLLPGWEAGPAPALALFAAVLLVGAVDVVVLGEETRGRALEEIAPNP